MRILLISGGQGLGFGVLTPDLALQGRLARRVATATSRGVDVVVVAEPFLSATDAEEVVRGHDLSRFDAVVFVLGTAEAMALTPVARWSRDIHRLLSVVKEAGHPELSVFITSVPGVPHRPGHRASVGTSVARTHAKRLNKLLTEAVIPFDVALLPFVPDLRPDGPRWRSSASYDRWAAQLAPAISADLARAGTRTGDAGRRDEERRQSAVDGLGLLDTAPEDRFDDIVRIARDAFGVDSAAIGLIDRGREWFKARAGDLPEELDRSEAICDVTIRQDGVFVVPDTTLDERFCDSPFVAGPDPVRFYAGHPIEAENGERVGALCLNDSAPRVFTTEDRRLLRDLALLAQEQLAARARTVRHR